MSSPGGRGGGFRQNTKCLTNMITRGRRNQQKNTLGKLSQLKVDMKRKFLFSHMKVHEKQ